VIINGNKEVKKTVKSLCKDRFIFADSYEGIERAIIANAYRFTATRR